jgi:hypothetical protein
MKLTTLEKCYREWLADNGELSQLAPSHETQTGVWRWLENQFGHCRTRKQVRKIMDEMWAEMYPEGKGGEG